MEKEGLYQVSINKRGNVVEIINALIHQYVFFKVYKRIIGERLRVETNAGINCWRKMRKYDRVLSVTRRLLTAILRTCICGEDVHNEVRLTHIILIDDVTSVHCTFITHLPFNPGRHYGCAFSIYLFAIVQHR